MNQQLDASSAIWRDVVLPDLSPLERNLNADVCVIGAGIAGLTTAYLLAAAGKQVVVLEAGSLGGGETGRTSAHLSSVSDDRFAALERIHGEEGARLFAASHAAAINEIESIIDRAHIDCDFRRVDGYLFQPDDEASQTSLKEELAAAQRAGHHNAKFLDVPPNVGFAIGPCLKFPDQAQFHPLKYIRGLVRGLDAFGTPIYPHSRVTEVQGGERAFVETADGFRVSCEHIVVATNSPFNNRFVLHTKQASYRSYVIGLQIPAGTIQQALYWDTLDPYHYIRLDRVDDPDGSKEVLIVGGEDHRTGQEKEPAERFGRLENWARKRFPTAQNVVSRWSGQIVEPVDGVAFIGRNPRDEENVYVVTGDSGMGLTHGTIAGMLITDLIQGSKNPWTELYSPGRISLRTIGNFAQENLNSAAQYIDWVTGSDVSSLEQIEPRSGAVIRSGLHKIAVYRDQRGEFHQCSAVCPHLGGIVAWNAVEHSWDCPCHGSRFTADGTVINGPAVGNLAESTVLKLPQEVVV